MALAALEKSRKFAQSAPKKVVKQVDPTSAANAANAPVAGSESERAEKNFEEGYGALHQGHTQWAVTKLAAAARALPQEARYRAYYGRALAAVTGASPKLRCRQRSSSILTTLPIG